MTITATNGNIDSYIVSFASDIIDSEYCYFLCGTDNREWHLVQASHQDGNHYTKCYVYHIYYDTYLPNSPSQTLFCDRTYEQDVYFVNNESFAYYSSDALAPNLKERRFENEIKNSGLIVCCLFFVSLFFSIFNQLLRRFG